MVFSLFVILSCSRPSVVEPDYDPEDIDEVSYIAIDPDGNLKCISIKDSISLGSETLLVYQERGISFDWNLRAVFTRIPWQAREFYLDSEEKTAYLEWNGNHLTGSCWYEGSSTEYIDQDVDDFSLHAWFVWAAFWGLPWHKDNWAVEFDIVTPDLDVYGYEGIFDGAAMITNSTGEDTIECYKLDIDGRGLIGLFAPDIKLYVRKMAPHIPMYCTVESEGTVLLYYADSL
ncbi:hypothetical protein KAH81_07755 [bacterium]|nr:hypothetical protein [bacterium]